MKMASTSRLVEPDDDASVLQPCLVSPSLVNICFESLSHTAIYTIQRTPYSIYGVAAAAKRVFSLLKHLFSDTQNTSLQHLIETSLMLQYNERDV